MICACRPEVSSCLQKQDLTLNRSGSDFYLLFAVVCEKHPSEWDLPNRYFASRNQKKMTVS